MNTIQDQVRKWRALDGNEPVQCRWEAEISVAGCCSYQTRIGRYSSAPNEENGPRRVMREDFQRCATPTRCPHFLDDSEAARLHERRIIDTRGVRSSQRSDANRGREMDRLTNPDLMLGEGPWKRSLVAR